MSEEVKRICAEVNGTDLLQSDRYLSALQLSRNWKNWASPSRSRPGATFRASMMAMYDLAVAMRDEGPTGEQRFNDGFKDHPMGDFHTFAGFDEIMELERKFMPEEELGKYDDSVGHRPQAAE